MHHTGGTSTSGRTARIELSEGRPALSPAEVEAVIARVAGAGIHLAEVAAMVGDAPVRRGIDGAAAELGDIAQELRFVLAAAAPRRAL